MVRINRVHTGIGDKGETSLLSGEMVSKSSARIELVGTVDELNALIGCVRTELDRINPKHSDGGSRATVSTVKNIAGPKLAVLQQDLFDLGGQFACHPDDLPTQMSTIDEDDSNRLIEEMDEWLEHLPPLESFILPTGSPVVASLHLARTVTRRAERCAVRLRDSDGDGAVTADSLSYINRLSDWLFVLSRWITITLGEEEILWTPKSKRK